MKEIRVLSQPSFHYFTKKLYPACLPEDSAAIVLFLPTNKWDTSFCFGRDNPVSVSSSDVPSPLFCHRPGASLCPNEPRRQTGQERCICPVHGRNIIFFTNVGLERARIKSFHIRSSFCHWVLYSYFQLNSSDSNRIWNIIWSIYHYYYKWTIIARGQRLQRVIIWSEQESN